MGKYWYTGDIIRKFNRASSSVEFFSAFLSSGHEYSTALSLKPQSWGFLQLSAAQGLEPRGQPCPLLAVAVRESTGYGMEPTWREKHHCCTLSTFICTAPGDQWQYGPLLRGITQWQKLYAMKQEIFNYKPCWGLTLSTTELFIPCFQSPTRKERKRKARKLVSKDFKKWTPNEQAKQTNLKRRNGRWKQTKQMIKNPCKPEQT